jgi:hypothetical protein
MLASLGIAADRIKVLPIPRVLLRVSSQS